MSGNRADDDAGSEPARERPPVADVPRKISPAKAAGGGGLLFIGAAIVYVVLHWHDLTHRERIVSFVVIHRGDSFAQDRF